MEEPPAPTSSSSPLPSPRPDPNLQQFPTTFVQADTTSFKQVVQMLTGTAETASAAAKAHPKPSTGPKRPAFKLYERRSSASGLKNSSTKHLNIVSPAKPQYCQQQRNELLLSPSALDFPSLVLSPVTPLVFDPAEGKAAIADNGFYLIPSPRPAAPEPPRLLTLFPLTSPKAADNSAS